jgi:hypothetical protein
MLNEVALKELLNPNEILEIDLPAYPKSGKTIGAYKPLEGATPKWTATGKNSFHKNELVWVRDIAIADRRFKNGFRPL